MSESIRFGLYYWFDVHLDKKDQILELLKPNILALNGYYLGTAEQGTAGQKFLDILQNDPSFRSLPIHELMTSNKIKSCTYFVKKGCIAHANFHSDKELKKSCRTITFKSKKYETALKKFWKSKHVVFEDACVSIGKYLAINGINYLIDIPTIYQTVEEIARTLANDLFGIFGEEQFEEDKYLATPESNRGKNKFSDNNGKKLYLRFLENSIPVFFTAICNNLRLFLSEKYSR